MPLIGDNKGCLYGTGKFFTEYTRFSKIHGIRIIGENRPPLERLLWALVILVTFLVCFSYIGKMYFKFRQSPVVVSFATQAALIHEVPFPAVTICPETKTQTQNFSYGETANKIRNKTEVSDFERKAFEYLYLICTHENAKDDCEFDEKYYDDDFYKTVSELSPEVEEVLDMCQWMNVIVNCSEIFTPVFIDQGVCYSFNLLDKSHIFRETAEIYGNFFEGSDKSNDWDPELGYAILGQNSSYPRRSSMSGRDHSLEVTMKLRQSDFDIKCNSAFQGFRVVIDNPLYIPRASKHYFRVSPDSATLISVKPKMITTSPTVAQFSASSRKCYFETERPLKYFKTYSQPNCFLECLSSYTLRRCECIHYYYPREEDATICGAYHYKCVTDAMDELHLLEIRYQLEHDNGVDSFCGCLPSCADLKYDAEVSSSGRRQRSEEGFTESALVVNFKSEAFLKRERYELYSDADMLAKFGGILSFWTGFSLISVFEIIYFFSIRLFCNRYLYRIWTSPDDYKDG